MAKSKKNYLLLGAVIAIAVTCALALLPRSSAPVESQTSFTTEFDSDLAFGDYRHFDLAEANYLLCQEACAAEAKCLAYTYTKPWQQYPAHCWLKDNVPFAVKGRDCCTSGIKQKIPSEKETKK